ncbi:SDR family oxidoreductase [Sphingobium baderi]|nr:SDR family oxidoreductase [Sphingobium baderi]
MFKDGYLAGQRILVTGGGTGLGRENAAAAARLGATVYICGRRRSVLEEAAAAINAETPGTIIPLECNLRSADSIEAMADRIWQDGPLNGLVNNAAGNFISRTEDISPRGFDAIAETVFRGTFLVTNACGRRWIAGGDKGSVVSILVTWIWNGGPFTVPSAMSKAGVHIMTQSLAVEWAPKGIRLNAVCPGAFPTPGTVGRLTPLGKPATSTNPMGRDGRMEELTNLVLFLLSPAAEYMTGQTMAIDGGGWQATGQNFAEFIHWTDRQWEEARAAARSIDAGERAKRADIAPDKIG